MNSLAAFRPFVNRVKAVHGGTVYSRPTFLGRLATYRYMDMHHVIRAARQIAADFVNKLSG